MHFLVTPSIHWGFDIFIDQKNNLYGNKPSFQSWPCYTNAFDGLFFFCSPICSPGDGSEFSKVKNHLIWCGMFSSFEWDRLQQYWSTGSNDIDFWPLLFQIGTQCTGTSVGFRRLYPLSHGGDDVKLGRRKILNCSKVRNTKFQTIGRSVRELFSENPRGVASPSVSARVKPV